MACTHSGWSEPSEFGVRVSVYVVSNAPADQAVKPMMRSLWDCTNASSELRYCSQDAVLPPPVSERS
jgi:hypothetical protein